ncbi:unnamed protein product [Caenorhabditis angaria]|uniref:NAD-dependent protein deacylase n=1 Tax=Caenorhabditis angaria TaxID=860376 RepID=A0A9P1IZE4_9PELO|nr:unnamed protein product [Caenorhabditis angaria]
MSKFVPKSGIVNKQLVKKFANQLGNHEKLLVITGAGISTESGIPDYRSEGVGLYARSNHRPIIHSNFMKSADVRQRYWARNFLAWPNFSQAKCNSNHYEVANWELSDRFTWLITQNVDGLHLKAGSKMVTELHGSGSYVRCMECDYVEHRDDLQKRMLEKNAQFMEKYTNPGEMAPDGDVMIEAGAEKEFVVCNCPECSGIIKTDVVFFGDFVPRTIVDFCHEKVDECDAILVLGSSLSVMSSYRFVHQANLQNKPIYIVNIGPTRADKIATMKLDFKISDVIAHI